MRVRKKWKIVEETIDVCETLKMNELCIQKVHIPSLQRFPRLTSAPEYTPSVYTIATISKFRKRLRGDYVERRGDIMKVGEVSLTAMAMMMLFGV